jgi:uncharacterized protein with HEPN domain
MPPQRDPRLHADDILQAIANIEADTADLDFERFAADRRTRQLVERNLEIISEASRRIPDHLKAAEPDIPWRDRRPASAGRPAAARASASARFRRLLTPRD